MRDLALRNDCYVVSNGASSYDTMGHLAATKKLYPELKNSSDKRRLALPNFPNSKSLTNLVYLQDTIPDHVSVYSHMVLTTQQYLDLTR